MTATNPQPHATVPPGYKQTEVGVIPEDWGSISMIELTDPTSPICYGVVQVGSDTEGGVPIVAIKHVKNIAHAPLHRAATRIESPYARSRVRGGDVLISIKGTIGRIGIVPDGFECNISRELARLRPSARCSSQYTAHQLEAAGTQACITKQIVGTTRLEFSIAALRQFRIPIPPTRAEQEAIAGALSDADAWIESLQKLIAKKRAIKQGTMQAILTPPGQPGHRRLPGFEGEWEVTTVGENIIKSFCGPSPTCDERNIGGTDEWGVLKTTAMTWENGWDWRRHKTLPRSYWNQPNIELQVGDVLVTKAGPRHRVGVTAWIDYVPGRIIPSGKMIALRPDPKKVVPLMLAAAISSPDAQTYLDQRTTGMAESQVNYENSVLLETPIRLPNPDEQTAIAAVLSDMDTEIEALEAKLAKAQQIKQGMMQELLTGRIRLI